MPDPVHLDLLYDSETWFEGGEKGGYQNYDQQTAQVLPIFQQLLSRYENTLSGREILDVGCGYGTHLAIAAAQGWNCFGIEVSAHAREIANQRHGQSFYLTDRVEHLIPHQFDLILMLDVVEHLSDPYKLLFELFSKGAITRKTRLVITTPNARCRDAISDPAGWAYRHPPSHLIYYSGESFLRMLARVHFPDITVSGIHPLPERPAASYPDENSSLNESLNGYGGLLCEARGSDFMSFMHERYVPGTWSKITEYEHLPRYVFAQQFAREARVLDFGCGTGYGSALLAEPARSVLGVDIDPTALEWARHTHLQSNLEFEQHADLGAGLKEGSFDLITCFEVIEHVDEPTQNRLIDSFARLLAAGGHLLISTPNPQVTVNYGENPYHLREMSETEFATLLGSRFRHVRMLKQSIRPSITITEGADPHEQRAIFHESAHDPSSLPANYVAICSQQRIPEVAAFCYLDTSSDYIGERLALERRHYETEGDLLAAKRGVTHLTTDVKSLAAALEARDGQVARLDAQISHLQAEITAIRSLKIYRFREAVRQPFSFRKPLRISYLLVAMATPHWVRILVRPWATKIKARLSRPAKTYPVRREHPRPLPRRAGPLRTINSSVATHVSVVIPTKNAGTLFSEVLAGIKSQQFNGIVDLTIVDSGSSDNTVDLAEQHGAKVIRITPANFDHGLTRNLGIEHTRGEVVVLLTQDAVPGSRQMIHNLVAALGDPQTAGVYARQVPRADADVLTRRNLNRWLTGRMEADITWLNEVQDYECLPPMKRYMLANFDNVCSAVRRSVWQEFRFRQTEFAEDVEWSKRVLEAGWKIAYEPTAFVIHSHRRTISYECKRTYLCHRKLNKLFGLTAVPSVAEACKSVLRATLSDWKYVWRNDPKFFSRVALLLRVPFFNSAVVYAQYRGVRDEVTGRARTVTGV